MIYFLWNILWSSLYKILNNLQWRHLFWKIMFNVIKYAFSMDESFSVEQLLYILRVLFWHYFFYITADPSISWWSNWPALVRAVQEESTIWPFSSSPFIVWFCIVFNTIRKQFQWAFGPNVSLIQNSNLDKFHYWEHNFLSPIHKLC